MYRNNYIIHTYTLDVRLCERLMLHRAHDTHVVLIIKHFKTIFIIVLPYICRDCVQIPY